MRTNTTSSNQGAIARDFQNVVTDAHELLKTVEREGEAGFVEAKSKLSGSLDAAKAKLGEYQESAVQAGRKYAEQTDKYVRDNPWRAVGVGAALGAVIGFLVARR
jgi:ElaB/YqjD/DUF883 family membrane-anchored ribosome-binding protein